MGGFFALFAGLIGWYVAGDVAWAATSKLYLCAFDRVGLFF